MNITGKIHHIGQVNQVSDSFKKLEFVLEYAENPMYPQYVAFQLIQDKVELVSAYNIGDMVDVAFNLRGRAWTGKDGVTKYFNSLDAWRINPAQAAIEAPTQPQPQTVPVVETVVTGGDLPF